MPVSVANIVVNYSSSHHSGKYVFNFRFLCLRIIHKLCVLCQSLFYSCVGLILNSPAEMMK